MRRFIALVSAGLLLSFAAVAAAGQVEGKVKSIDSSARTLTLEDGTQITLPDGIALDQLREGADVTVSYEEKDGKNQATNVEMK